MRKISLEKYEMDIIYVVFPIRTVKQLQASQKDLLADFYCFIKLLGVYQQKQLMGFDSISLHLKLP